MSEQQLAFAVNKANGNPFPEGMSDFLIAELAEKMTDDQWEFNPKAKSLKLLKA